MPDTANPSRSSSLSLRNIRGLRLGRCARRILLLAPLPSQELAVVPPERPDRACADSHRRATRSLAAHGLIELAWKTEIVETKQVRRTPRVRWDAVAGVYRDEAAPTPVERAIKRRTVRLTPLGALVVDRLRPVLENGRRIRWDRVDDVQNR